MNTTYIKLLLVILVTFSCNFLANSFPTSYYTSNSALSSGKWVKIKVSTTGVAEISNDELKSFGFQNPESVKIFGRGGDTLPETLSMSMVDDIKQIPTFRKDNKLYFYAVAGRRTLLSGSTTSRPRFITQNNPYSSDGYYFLTDANVNAASITTIDNPNIGTNLRTQSLDVITHESDIINVGGTGKTFLGEDFTASQKISLQFEAPYLVEGTTILVNPAVGYLGEGAATISASLNGENIAFSGTSASLRASESVYEYFVHGAPYAYISPSSFSTTLNVEVGVTPTSGIVRLIKLDYVNITYTRHNSLALGTNQCKLTFPTISFNDAIQVTDTDGNTVVWNITNPLSPIQYQLTFAKDEEAGTYNATFTPQVAGTNNISFVAFNTSREQNKVTFVEEIANQNLHAANVPDMLIITVKSFLPYAETIANLHSDIDGMDVLVVDQDAIFNEFSAGTPDATAYRRFAKMLFDKDPSKFKYLLLFGTGSFDNRDVNNNRSKDRLLTYQSDNSSIETESYTTDDYFAILGDGSGADLANNTCHIGVGRMPVATIEEAENAVNKLTSYINNTDYTSWRNGGLIIADDGDDGLHMYQAEGVEMLLNDTLDIKLHMHKVYASAFPTNSYGNAEAANKKTIDLLKQGQLFATYVGHGNPNTLTKSLKLWNRSDVTSTSYKNIPLFTLATCDVARFDSDNRGIAELMFHQPEGGAIACLASARTVYADENDILNRAFISKLFTPGDDGSFPTLGDAIKAAKNHAYKRSINKLNYLLLGDPAMRLKYPKHNITITSINDSDPANAVLSPLSKASFKGYIGKDAVIDTDFNGKVSVSIYDAKKKLTTISLGEGYANRDAYICNDILGTYSAEVTNGEFTIDCILPKDCQSVNGNAEINFYAYNYYDKRMVNGMLDNIVVETYNPDNAVNDDLAPTIDTMYIDTEDFADGDMVSTSPVLYATFSDDIALNTQSLSIGNAYTLILDNNITYDYLSSNITWSDDAKSGKLTLNIDNLNPGKHTLELRISDIANNRASHTISFLYPGVTPGYDINVEEYPAREKATFNIVTPDANNTLTNALIRVVDNRGNTVWSINTSSATCEWNLCDKNGERVNPGAYYYYAQISSSNGVTSTLTKKIVIVKQ